MLASRARLRKGGVPGTPEGDVRAVPLVADLAGWAYVRRSSTTEVPMPPACVQERQPACRSASRPAAVTVAIIVLVIVGRAALHVSGPSLACCHAGLTRVLAARAFVLPAVDIVG